MATGRNYFITMHYQAGVKAARRPWAARTVFEFAIKSRFIVDSWKTSCCPWIFSGVLENSCIL